MDRLGDRSFNGRMPSRDHLHRPAVEPGQTLENPVTGERFTFLHTAASTGGELLAFELGLEPGGAVPIPHVHPIQTERFEVRRGPDALPRRFSAT